MLRLRAEGAVLLTCYFIIGYKLPLVSLLRSQKGLYVKIECWTGVFENREFLPKGAFTGICIDTSLDASNCKRIPETSQDRYDETAGQSENSHWYHR